MVRIGLLADSHVPHRLPALPPAVFTHLSGVDLILHAGDLVDPAILKPLGRIAPVQAVRGNLHLQSPWPNDQRLPMYLDLNILGHRLLVTHGHLSHLRNLIEKWWLLLPNHPRFANHRLMKRLVRAFPGADVYIFGHSHRATVVRWRGALFVNPGATCPTRNETPSVARLTVTTEGVEAEILRLGL